MTNPVPEQPKRSGYNPITLGDVPSNPPDPFFSNLDNPASRIVAVPLFLLIFALSGNSAVAAPLVVLILLACLLFRMTPRERTITAAPLTFSAVRLGAQMAGPLGIWQYAMPATSSPAASPFESGRVWLPLFLAAYLFFTSTIDTNTGRVVFWYSLTVLLSGLLPGEGYAVICAILYYTLFFVILVSMVSDISPRPNARPLTLGPESARA